VHPPQSRGVWVPVLQCAHTWATSRSSACSLWGQPLRAADNGNGSSAKSTTWPRSTDGTPGLQPTWQDFAPYRAVAESTRHAAARVQPQVRSGRPRRTGATCAASATRATVCTFIGATGRTPPRHRARRRPHVVASRNPGGACRDSW
jgi:hypothetical protein